MQLNSLLDRLPNEIAHKIMSLATIIGRLRVLGFNLKKELNYNNEGCVFKRISDLVCLAKSRYFLLHLIAKHLTINNETQSAIKQELYYGHNSFGSESFDNKIRETQINLEAIYYDQNECNIQKLCDFMNSLKDDISTRREKTIVDFKFEIREHPIKIPDDEGMGEEFLNSAKYAKSYITSIRDCFSDKMGLLLSSHCIIDNQKTSNEFLINPGLFMVINENVFVKRAHDFDQMVNVIKEMIETEEEPNIHIATQIGTFPLILLMENAKKVKLNCGEFLSCDNIVLGEDVSFMATNTMANKEKLQAYIDSHNLNVEPCLFDDLKYLSKHSMTKPEFQQYIRMPPENKLEKCIPCSPNDDSNHSVCFSIKNKLIGFFKWFVNFKVYALVVGILLFPKVLIIFLIIQLITTVWLKYNNKSN